MPHLRSVSLRPSLGASGQDRFPFDLPIVQSIRDRMLSFIAAVTCFIGESGSGKSTLLEAIVWATQLPAIGQSDIDIDPTLEHGRELGRESLDHVTITRDFSPRSRRISHPSLIAVRREFRDRRQG